MRQFNLIATFLFIEYLTVCNVRIMHLLSIDNSQTNNNLPFKKKQFASVLCYWHFPMRDGPTNCQVHGSVTFWKIVMQTDLILLYSMLVCLSVSLSVYQFYAGNAGDDHGGCDPRIFGRCTQIKLAEHRRIRSSDGMILAHTVLQTGQ